MPGTFPGSHERARGHAGGHTAVMQEQLRDKLVADGEAALGAARRFVSFTGNDNADKLLNDIDGHRHAFVLAALVDRQIRADKAWLVPELIRQRLGSFAFADLESLSPKQWVALMREPTPAHRMPETMADVLQQGAARIRLHYGGDASLMWSDRPPSARAVRRFLDFRGAGPKIATMAVNILVRDFRVPLRDYRYIDISADVHVCRVMARLGFVEEGASPAAVIYAARELNPDFPGIFDLTLWDLGRTVCRPTAPQCSECPLREYCRTATLA